MYQKVYIDIVQENGDKDVWITMELCVVKYRVFFLIIQSKIIDKYSQNDILNAVDIGATKELRV